MRDLRKTHGIHFRRQAPIGPFVVDFAVQKHKLILEVDGEHHFTPDAEGQDQHRDKWLNKAGYRVLRFTTGDLDDLEACINTVLDHLGQL
ncbi:MAG: endonuclease domain-containing protein [Ahrensia sp.]|nr:endonuclease domain-containing protein [Ahrensia sp.]